MKHTILFLIILWSRIAMGNSDIYTIGFLPTTMPRDPINVDIFLEHIAIGQVLETIVKIDTNGDLAPNIASSWRIENDGTVFTFEIKKGLKFSSGKELTCKDIKFSIERHKNSNHSQSSHYLKNIKNIECQTPHSITFSLQKPQVSFLKVLTRDHLGILPEGWIFDKTKAEPWIGSGPYRLLKENEKYYFVKNNLYRSQNQVKISRWEILNTESLNTNLHKSPDLLLHTPKEKIDELVKSQNTFSSLSFIKPMHLIQTSIWWYPEGNNFNDSVLRETVMGIFDDFVLQRGKENSLELSTGVVPNGVQGHIPKRIKMIYEKKKRTVRKEVTVAVYPNEYDLIVNSSFLINQAKELGIIFKFIKVDFAKKNFLLNLRPDIVIATYAGGFNDPDGFLIVLGNILEIDPYKFLGPMESVYKEASKDHNWTNRGHTFQKINEFFIRNQLLVPGWKKNILIGKSSRLIENSAFYEYSLHLEDFLPQKE